jgi:GntR family transcriptional regulator
VGTFVTRSLTDSSLSAHKSLRSELIRWLAKARRAGLDDDGITALFDSTFGAASDEDIA